MGSYGNGVIGLVPQKTESPRKVAGFSAALEREGKGDSCLCKRPWRKGDLNRER